MRRCLEPTRVAKHHSGGDNHPVEISLRSNANKATREVAAPFLRGCMVVVTLNNPREKFWGMILALAPEGLTLTGVELSSMEDLVIMIKDGEPSRPAVVFFPMHRLERIELDSCDASVPSLADRFASNTGLNVSTWLTSPLADDSAKSAKEQPSRAAKIKTSRPVPGVRAR